MKRAAAALAVLCLLTALTSSLAVSEAPAISAASCIVTHADSGAVLYERAADERMLVASTTKIMTALVVLESCEPDEYVLIKPEHSGIEGSSMYLAPGDRHSVSDLLCGMLLASGNDAAVALACHAGGSVEGFARLMNAKAAELGLENSSFKNPHGLDAEGHYSSARDLAVITAEAMRQPLFERIVSTKCAEIDGKTFYNHNKLLSSYEGAIGVKTGYTMAAGRSLVSCAERDGLRLICVTLSDPDDWRDHAALLDWGFENYSYENVIPPGEYIELPVISGSDDSVGVMPARELKVLLSKERQPELYVELPRFVYAPVEAGLEAGRLRVQAGGVELGEVELVYCDGVRVADDLPLTPWEQLRRAWYLACRYGPTGFGYYGLI